MALLFWKNIVICFFTCLIISILTNSENENIINSINTLKNDFKTLLKDFETLEETMRNMIMIHEMKLAEEKLEGEQQMRYVTEKIANYDFVNDTSVHGSVKTQKNIHTKSYGYKANRRFLASPSVSPYLANQTAFSVCLGHNLANLGHLHTIVYDQELLDTVDSYNKNNGVFTVPSDGIYLLNWSTMTGHAVYQGTELVVNGKHVSYSFASDTYGYESSDKTVLLRLKAGDTVWIRTDNDSGNDGSLRGDGYNSFSGFLIYPE